MFVRTVPLQTDALDPGTGRLSQAARTLGGGDRVLRSRSLPRAVREPVPARLPGEVPGLGARNRLVARQSPGADGRLPRRLRPALEGRRRPALPALPAGQPDLLALLLDLGGDGRPLA